MRPPEGASVPDSTGAAAAGGEENVGEAVADTWVVVGALKQGRDSSWACLGRCLGLACPCMLACQIWLSPMHLKQKNRPLISFPCALTPYFKGG